MYVYFLFLSLGRLFILFLFFFFLVLDCFLLGFVFFETSSP